MFFLVIILGQICFCSKLPLRVHGGIDAQSGEFPYVVRIELQTVFNFMNNIVIAPHHHKCTASALSPVWLLSAAHCFIVAESMIQKWSPNATIKMVIRYGHVENLPWEKDSFTDVLYTVTHPLFMLDFDNQGGLRKIRNDIGLLKVSPINMRSYIKVSAVDYYTMDGHQVILAGFGIMTKINNEGQIKTHDTLNLMKPLQILKVLISKCGRTHPFAPALCLASRCNDVNHSCPGDSGGPIIHTSGVIGVISGSEMTGYCLDPTKKDRLNAAAFITPVSPYIEWIYRHMTDAQLMSSVRPLRQ